ncbi:DUF6232 family protein [Nostoc sp.]|uniref:DUF6232 family protein n=1 Tax=Nostoc sp. TaxID=1180 RepID=UPI002FF58EC3
MIIFDFLKINDDNKTVKKPDFIEFSKQTVRFGDSIYQLKNVTGFAVGAISKKPIPCFAVILFALTGLLICYIISQLNPENFDPYSYNLINWLFIIGIGLIGLAIIITISHFLQVQRYGFTLYLNSGQIKHFISADQKFLSKIVSSLYKLLEGSVDGVTVNWQDKSVTIHGDMQGIVSMGEGTTIN